MSFTETIAAGRAFAAPGEPRPDPNQELVATGVSNLLGGLFGAMPGGGGTSQTAVNRKAGARTQVAALVTAGVALAALLFLAPVVGLIPHATLAGVVIATSIGLVGPPTSARSAATGRRSSAGRSSPAWASCCSARSRAFSPP